jgi:hypothetical protein
MAKSGDSAVDKWIWTREHEFSNNRPPIIAMPNKLVFKKVNEGTLVVALAEEVPPVVKRNLAG